MVALVIDTNVLVAACLKDEGASRKVVKRCLTGKYQPFIGTALFLEYEEQRGILGKRIRQLHKGAAKLGSWEAGPG